jgi:hypothetical protein
VLVGAPRRAASGHAAAAAPARPRPQPAAAAAGSRFQGFDA